MLKAVLFDIDGTLIDSVDLHARAWQDAFRKYGKEIPFADIRPQIGKGGDQILPLFFTEDEIRRFGKEMSEWRGEHFKQAYLPQVKPFPKVRELFLRLRADGRRLLLASSARKDELAGYCAIAGICDLIEDATSADDAARSKPAPDIFEAALLELDDVDPDECIMVGDSPYDAEGAAKAHIRTIGLLCGGSDAARLREAGCIELYRDCAELLEKFDSSALGEPPLEALSQSSSLTNKT